MIQIWRKFITQNDICFMLLAPVPVITSTDFPEPLKTALRSPFPGPWLRPVNSVGVKVGFLVRREGDIYLTHHPVHLWDTAGPLAILEEAGGHPRNVPVPEDVYARGGMIGPADRDWKGRDNVVAEWTFGSGAGPTIILNGHMDTVGAEGMHIPPFDPRERDAA